MASRLPAFFAPDLFSSKQLARSMIDDYTNQARKPVCRFDNDLFRSDDCNDKTGILMDRCRVMVGMHQGPDSCKYPVRNEGTAAQYPSKFPVRAEGTPAQYPSKPPV